MADIINLRRARKAHKCAEKEKAASANRARFGESKAARALNAARGALDRARHEAHRRANESSADEPQD